MTHTDQPIQELMSRVKLVRESQDELVRSLAQHPEIRSMPYPTLREGTLCEPYHSQLDLYAKMREGFNPKEERRFVLDQDLGRIQTVIDKVIGQVLPK